MPFDLTQDSHVALKKVLSEKTSGVIGWVGAGLSAPAGLPSWPGLLDSLIDVARRKNASITADGTRLGLEATLLEERKKKNYWLCFQLLEQLLGATTYQAEIRERLDSSTHSRIPPAYVALWKAGVQGLITFNLDQFASRSFSSVNHGAALDHFIGEQAKHLVGVLQRNRPFVGNVHGVVDNVSSWIFTYDKLKNLLGDPGYRQFVAGCLLSRTIFFVGISADDVAVQTHLESVRKAGITGITHYWLTSRVDSDTDSWSEQYGIRVIRYTAVGEDHSEALECLRDLAVVAPSRDAADRQPVLFGGLAPTESGELSGPDLMVSRPLEELRRSLNAHALSLLSQANEESYNAYDQFSATYDEAIDRAWYVNATPPKNVLLGYTLLRRAAQGSFGDVYEALDKTGNRVAIKLLRRDVRREPAMLQTFRRGVRSMRILREHGVPGMIEFIDASEIPAFVVMEWIDGPDLMAAVESRLLTDWRSVLTVARDLARIIHRAHLLPERVLHRDIRPPNVMLKDYWTNGNEINVVVMDFDLSWHVDALEKSIVAKPLGFMAPEQLHQRATESTRSALVDSFGLGMTLYYMMTGDVPVPDQQRHKDWEETLSRRVRGKACEPWRSLPYRMARLIQGATQDLQRHRWDFARIVTELENLLAAHEGAPETLPVDYYCEEVAAHADTMHNYFWEDEKSAAAYRSGGLAVEVGADLPSDEVRLSMEWRQTGDENWKLLPKTGAQVMERAKPSLERHGWADAKFEGSYGFMRVTAKQSPRDKKFSPAQLAKGIDALVQVMLPKT
jgi:eukaryotic-like serine/threonine-protein kinase